MLSDSTRRPRCRPTLLKEHGHILNTATVTDASFVAVFIIGCKTAQRQGCGTSTTTKRPKRGDHYGRRATGTTERSAHGLPRDLCRMIKLRQGCGCDRSEANSRMNKAKKYNVTLRSSPFLKNLLCVCVSPLAGLVRRL